MPQQPYSTDHDWQIAAYIPIGANRVRQAVKRGAVRIDAETKVDVCEVLCIQCRKPYDAVAGQPCAAAEAEGREHLIGGTPGERKKRKHPYHDCDAVGCELATRPGAAGAAGAAG